MTSAQFKKSSGYWPIVVLVILLYLISFYFALSMLKYAIAPVPGDETPMAMGILVSAVSPAFIGSWAICAFRKVPLSWFIPVLAPTGLLAILLSVL